MPRLFHLLLCISLAASAAAIELRMDADTPPAVQRMLDAGLDLIKRHTAIPYVDGGEDEKGMDCSGAVTWLLEKAGITPPRSSAAQFAWLLEKKALVMVPGSVTSSDDPVFANLKPGDLIFWGTSGEREGAETITHVHMFLGHEPDGHPVMIGSSDGRSYRGQKVSGFGVTDFKVPERDSKKRILAYGHPDYAMGKK